MCGFSKKEQATTKKTHIRLIGKSVAEHRGENE